jgi:hypothetical protein
MDPIREVIERWRGEREVFTRSGSDDLIRLSETHSEELMHAVATLATATVPYNRASELTGYALGSLKNMGLENVGSRSNPAFRLSDLPFKSGKASPAKLLMAASVLRASGEGLRFAENHLHDDNPTTHANPTPS